MPSVDLEVVTPVATKLSKPQSPTTTAVDSGNQCVWSPAYGGEPSIDTYTINYIHRIYCRECRMEELRRKKDQEGNKDQPTSPPMEDKSLQQAMDKNKESLKRRLMLRRSVNELVDQGIYPPLKTPPGYAEQRRQLERAKTGDLLRHKLEHRPDRQSLVQHHILEDTNVDPSLQDRQRQLKKAKLQDSLSERLLNRPGPLELVEGNILQIDPQLKDAIKEGKLHFTKTTEVDVPQRRHFRFNTEDGSSSEGAPSPGSSNDLSATTPSPTSMVGIPPAPDIGPLLQKIQQSAVIQGQQFTLTPTTALGSQMLTALPLAVTPPPVSATAVIKPGVVITTQNGTSSSSSSSIKKNRVQKAKPNKATPKSKVIKFHEYKGPPSLVKSTTSTSVTSPSATTCPTPPPPVCPPLPVPTMLPSPGGVDTPYNVMLKQQQLYLQWQLEFQQKKLPFILTPAQDPKSLDSSPSSSPSATATSTPAPPPPAPPPPPVRAITPTRARTTPSPAAASTPLAVVSPVITPQLPLTTTTITTTTPAPAVTRQQDSTTKVTKLEDLKVADLKAELKRRNLPVSGTKPQLIERLNHHAEAIIGSFATSASSTSASSVSDTYTSPRSVQSLASPSSVGSLGGIVNIQPVTPLNPTEELSNFAMDTTPVSPSSSVTDLNTSISSHLSQPMSPPENPMDMAVPSPPSFSIGTQAIVKAYLSSSQSIVPMSVDQHLSRPPSAAPMEVDLNGSQSSLHLMGMDQNQNPHVIAHTQPSNQYLTQASPAQTAYTQVPKPHTPVSSRTPTPHATSFQQSPSPHAVTPISQPATPLSLIQLQQPATPQTNQLHQLPAPQSQTPTPQISAQLGTPTSVVRVQTPTASPAPPAASPQPQPIVIQPQTPELPVQQTPQQLRFTANQQFLQQMQEKLNFQAAAVQLRQQQQQVGQPQVITHEQLVRQQQKQIEELQRQLQQSQVRLTEAENQAKQHQTALQRHLAQLQQLHTAQQQQQQQLQNAQQQVLASQQAVGTADATAVAAVPDTSVLATQSQGGQRRENRVPPQQPVFQIVPMQQSQQQQTIPSITLTNSTTPVTKVEKRETKASCLQQTNLQRGGQLQQPRLLQLATLQQPNGQQLLITAQHNPVQVQPANASQNKIVTSLNNQVNGISSTNKASSVPTSPVGGTKLHRSATSPFFTNMTLREPPKYDEAIKNKQNVLMQQTVAEMLSSTPALNSAINNCQAMDDVLEILIRSGELPASAAQEPPPTPKTCTVTSSVTSSHPSSTATQPVMSTILIPASSGGLHTGSTITIPAVSLGTSPITIPGYSLAGSTFTGSTFTIPASSLSGSGFTIPASIAGSAFTIPPSSTTLLTTKDIPVPVSSLLASVPQAVTTTTSIVTPVSSPAIVNASQTRVPNAYTTTTPSSTSSNVIKKEPPTPLSVDISVTNSTDLVASLTEHLPSSFTDLPFMTMDWSDSDIPDSLLDTPNPDSVHSDCSSRFTDQSIGSHDLLSVSCSGNVLGQIQNGSIHGSEPHLNSLGVGDVGDVAVTDVTNAMNVDVSDWLDVIMPSTGLTPLSNASVSFPVSDPILTPKTQDVLADLFNMDDTDLCTPADLGINFEQAMEASSSKS